MEEVRQLNSELPADAPAWKATGYRLMRDYVTGVIARGRAREAILIETRQYAKRQRTWFRHQLDEQLVTRVNPMDRHWRAIVERWWQAGALEREARRA